MIRLDQSPCCQEGRLGQHPTKCNRKEPICFSPFLYRARNLVERFFNKIKHCRRVATRCDKLAANYLAFVQLAQQSDPAIWIFWDYAGRLGNVGRYPVVHTPTASRD
jgi:hypothetical protein